MRPLGRPSSGCMGDDVVGQGSPGSLSSGGASTYLSALPSFVLVLGFLFHKPLTSKR